MVVFRIFVIFLFVIAFLTHRADFVFAGQGQVQVITSDKIQVKKTKDKDKKRRKDGKGMSLILLVFLCIYLPYLAFLWVGIYTRWREKTWLWVLLIQIAIIALSTYLMFFGIPFLYL